VHRFTMFYSYTHVHTHIHRSNVVPLQVQRVSRGLRHHMVTEIRSVCDGADGLPEYEAVQRLLPFHLHALCVADVDAKTKAVHGVHSVPLVCGAFEVLRLREFYRGINARVSSKTSNSTYTHKRGGRLRKKHARGGARHTSNTGRH
jgi:hypothetical protein